MVTTHVITACYTLILYNVALCESYVRGIEARNQSNPKGSHSTTVFYCNEKQRISNNTHRSNCTSGRRRASIFDFKIARFRRTPTTSFYACVFLHLRPTYRPSKAAKASPLVADPILSVTPQRCTSNYVCCDSELFSLACSLTFTQNSVRFALYGTPKLPSFYMAPIILCSCILIESRLTLFGINR